MAGTDLRVYDLRGRRFRVCLLSPLSDTFSAIPPLVMVFLLFLGGWVMAASAAGLVAFFLTSSQLSVRADSEAIYVRNRFFRHRIPWAEVRGIVARNRSTMFTLIPTVLIRRRRSVWFAVALYATLGMSRQRRREVALELAETGARAGYSFPAGSEADLAKEDAAPPTAGA